MLKRFPCAMTGLLLTTSGALAQNCSGGLPYTFSSGATADATKVNANFNYLLSCFATLGSGFVNKLRNGTFVSWTNGTSETIAPAATGVRLCCRRVQA
jgi:hypothetical protein